MVWFDDIVEVLDVAHDYWHAATGLGGSDDCLAGGDVITLSVQRPLSLPYDGKQSSGGACTSAAKVMQVGA